MLVVTQDLGALQFAHQILVERTRIVYQLVMHIQLNIEVTLLANNPREVVAIIGRAGIQLVANFVDVALFCNIDTINKLRISREYIMAPV